MAHKVIDRCKETTSSTGTGNLTLTGAVSGFVSMANAATGLTSNGDTGWFCAEAGAQWEVFLGTRISATELARTTVLSSSTGSTINFSTPPVVFSTVPASRVQPRIFKAYRASTNQSVTTGVYTKVQLNAEEVDSHGEFDSTTNFRWTPLVPGWYLINFRVHGVGTSATTVLAALYKNGALITYSNYAAAVGGETVSTGAELIYMNGSTDYLELYAYINGTSPIVKYGADRTTMSGVLVSATG
jgi:hypothetical protein